MAAPACAGGVALLFTLGVDLGSKALAVAASPPLVVVYDPRHVGDWRARLLLSFAAVLVVCAGSLLAAWRGLGRLWGAWIGAGLLVGGIAGNGVSHALWAHGTPDFVWLPGRYVWNVADLAISVGLAGGILSIAVAAFAAVWREHRAARAAS